MVTLCDPWLRDDALDATLWPDAVPRALYGLQLPSSALVMQHSPRMPTHAVLRCCCCCWSAGPAHCAAPHAVCVLHPATECTGLRLGWVRPPPASSFACTAPELRSHPGRWRLRMLCVACLLGTASPHLTAGRARGTPTVVVVAAFALLTGWCPAVALQGVVRSRWVQVCCWHHAGVRHPIPGSNVHRPCNIRPGDGCVVPSPSHSLS